jgi:hypothetical protein
VNLNIRFLFVDFKLILAFMAGYSSTSLAKKLGIKPGFKIKLINQPDYYFDLFTDLPTDIKIIKGNKDKKDFIHYFETSLQKLYTNIPLLKKELESAGMLWISWYKKSAKIPTDITEDDVRKIALSNGFVDIKVCAVDDAWSGLKLVIPVSDR